MQYYNTEYPFAFIEGLNRYDIPFSIKLDLDPLTDDKREFYKISYDPPLYTDTEYYNYTVNKISGNADLYYAMQYKIISDTSDDISFVMSLIICSSAPFSASVNYGVKYVGTDYTDNETTVSNAGDYTYNDKTIYYYVYNVTSRFVKTGGTLDWHTSTALNANDWAIYYNTAEKYFAWLIQYGDKIYTNDPYNRPPDTEDAPRGGQGSWDNSSDVVTIDPLPAGLWGQGFVSVYVPTVAQLQAFATQIWREDLKNKWKDLFPSGVLSGIVDCFTIPIQPDTSGVGVITIGTQPVGAESAILANRFKIVDFGNLTIGEYFGAFADYTTTKIAIYLPYIGWEQLAPEMIINATINLQYKIDCMTGDFVAIISTNRRDKFRFEGVSYVFNGNCATKIPLTSQAGAGTSSTISAAISGIGGTAAGLMSGNYIGAAMSAASAVNSICADTNKHTFALKGGFSGAKGQLGAQRPYLIINRPVMENGAKNQYFNLCGIPSNDYATVGSCRGFTKCYAVKLDDSNFAGATEDEKQQIISLLQGGIFV